MKTFRPNWIPPRLPPRAVASAAGSGGAPPPDPSRSFYWSAAWRALRLDHLRLEPLCRACLARGVTKLASTVHHDKPRDSHPGLELDPGNLVSACTACHNRLHPEKGKR